jgi:hypothetical protein
LQCIDGIHYTVFIKSNAHSPVGLSTKRISTETIPLP